MNAAQKLPEQKATKPMVTPEMIEAGREAGAECRMRWNDAERIYLAMKELDPEVKELRAIGDSMAYRTSLIGRKISEVESLRHALQMCVIERSEWLDEARAALAKLDEVV